MNTAPTEPAGVGKVGGEHISTTVAQQVIVRDTDKGSRGGDRQSATQQNSGVVPPLPPVEDAHPRPAVPDPTSFLS